METRDKDNPEKISNAEERGKDERMIRENVLSIYTRCFLRKVALRSCTLAARPR